MSKLEEIISDRADWLVDAVATATQNRMFLRGDPECDDVACDAILMNGAKAIRVAITRTNPGHVIFINGVECHVNDAVKDAFEKMKSACDAVSSSASYRMDIGAVEACRIVSKTVVVGDGCAIRYDGTGEDALRQMAAATA